MHSHRGSHMQREAKVDHNSREELGVKNIEIATCTDRSLEGDAALASKLDSQCLPEKLVEKWQLYIDSGEEGFAQDRQAATGILWTYAAAVMPACSMYRLYIIGCQLEKHGAALHADVFVGPGRPE